ncbi:hypothetical protein MKY59_05960 [Paenibacillus sp. FSL W8-0426]|uniref:hypothetical protein n=1 Tax=Paenibacillus sp. FSL W8-0426 TaxID=2921714 RepID=UPI0030DB012A
MSEPKTPNLALNQIDRSSPATTYFDLDRYLDQNWGKVDDFAGEIKEQVDEVTSKADGLKERLDTEQRKSVTLKPGLQVIEAERASAFRLEGLKGRTLVNLLGRDGGFEGYNNWAIGAMSASLDTTTYAEGSTSSLRVTLASENSNINRTITTVIGKKYVLIADVKNVSSERAHVSINALVDGNKVMSDSFDTSFVSFTATAAAHTIAVVGSGSPGQTFNVDNVRLYEVSTEEYNALGSMTPTQVSAKYPYTEMITGVKNPYAIRYGENLLPPFYEWTSNYTNDKWTIWGPYTAQLRPSAPTFAISMQCEITLAPNTKYTISAEQTDGATFSVIDITHNTALVDNTTNTTTFTTGSTGAIRVYISSYLASGGIGGALYTFRNLMLTAGDKAHLFKQREDAMLALQTELYADPATGANPDMVFEREGQYFKLVKWHKVVLDGSKIITLIQGNNTGYKTIYPKVEGVNYDYFSMDAAVAVKSDGKILKWGSHEAAADAWAVDKLNKNLAISVSAEDSGWGDAYTPTADEIKAYFMGWRMYDGLAGGTPYNGTGTKYWHKLSDGTSTPGAGTTTLPTTPAPNYTPYQLLYQLATPVVEPITSEGQLTFFEGDNQVELGTGIVLREGVKPARYGDWAVVNYTYDGNHALLQNKADVIKSVYKNSKKISDYLITRRPQVSYGNEYIGIPWTDFDSTDLYNVTYLMLAKYPTASFDGSYAENEKALLLDAVRTLQKNTTRISVLESKKAEKDIPAWIKPTLLNGWVSYNDGNTTRYFKDSQGFVHVQGMVKSGAAGQPILLLPAGYRPGQTLETITNAYTGTDVVTPNIEISSNGTIIPFGVTAPAWLSLDNIKPFLAEQ